MTYVTGTFDHRVSIGGSNAPRLLFAIEIVAIPKYDDCSIEVHPCRGTSGTTDRGQRTDA
jgi:hypothetical protein